MCSEKEWTNFYCKNHFLIGTGQKSRDFAQRQAFHNVWMCQLVLLVLFIKFWLYCVAGFRSAESRPRMNPYDIFVPLVARCATYEQVENRCVAVLCTFNWLQELPQELGYFITELLFSLSGIYSRVL
jgi:hypothetical protein